MEGIRWKNAVRGLTVTAVAVGGLLLTTTAAPAADGGAMYTAHCAACHGDDGEGRGSFPALDGNPLVDDETAVADVVRSGRGVMPAYSQLSDDEISALTAYLRATWGTGPDGNSGETTDTTGATETNGGTATTVPDSQGAGGLPAGPGDPAHGEALFVGATAFENGAPPCMPCHSAGANGRAGGGRLLGTDLTDLAARGGGAEGIAGMLAAPAFPVMRAAYENKLLTAQERADLGAYFEHLAASGSTSGSVFSGRLWLLGAAGAAVLFGLMGLLWPRHRITAGERLRGGAR
ncbi:MAG: c-type cytochrome [Thermoleophilia bacterium]